MTENYRGIQLKKTIRKREVAIFFLALVAVTLVNFLFIGNNYYVNIVWDEAGYIGNAAALVGKNWSPFFSGAGTPYYAYGYSLFIALGMKLAEAFSLPELTFLVPKIASALGMTLVMPIAYYVGRKVFPGAHYLMIALSSVMAACFPPFIYHLTKLWPESHLYFLFWLLTFLLSLVDQKSKGQWFFLTMFGFVAAFIYWVHHRGIGVSIAAVIIVVVLYLRKTIKLKHLVLFALSFVGTTIGSYLVDIWIENSLFSLPVQNPNPMSNDIGSFSVLVKALITFDPLHWDNLLRNTAGALFYLNASSLLLVSVFIFFSFFPIKRYMSKSMRRSTDPTASAGEILWVFVLLAFLLSLLVGSISICNASTPRYRFYGRYSEFSIGPMLVFSILALAENSQRKLRILLVSAIALGSNALLFLVNMTSFANASDITTLVSPGFIWSFRLLEAAKSAFSGIILIENEGIWILIIISVLTALLVLLPFLLPKKIRGVFLAILLVLTLTGAVYSGTLPLGSVSETEKNEIFRRVEVDHPTYFWIRSTVPDINQKYYLELFAATYCLAIAPGDIPVLFGEEILDAYPEMPIGTRVITFAGNDDLLDLAFANGGLRCIYRGEKFVVWDKLDNIPVVVIPGGITGPTVLHASDLSEAQIRGFYGTEVNEKLAFSWTQEEMAVTFDHASNTDRVNIWLAPQLVEMMRQINVLSGFDVYLDGELITSVSAETMQGEEPIVVEFPDPIEGDSCEIMLICKGFVPKERGISEDVRTLGLPVVRISVSADNE